MGSPSQSGRSVSAASTLPSVGCAMRDSPIGPAQMPKPNPPMITGTVMVR